MYAMKLLIVSVFLVWMISILAHGTKYHLPQGWEVVNNNRLPEFTASQGNASYRLLQAGNTSLVSQDGRFALSFFRFNDSPRYYFALVFGASNYTSSSASGVCVWSANRDNPVTENATLQLSDQGLLQVMDSDGRVVWNSPRGVSGIEVQDSGNVVLYDSTGGVSWQSFDHPTDVLLEGQVIVTGQSLVSSSSSSSLSSGSMKMEVVASGLIFLLELDTVQPYLVWNMWNGNLPSDVTSINTSCPSYRIALHYSAGSVEGRYQATRNNTSDQPCGPPTAAVLGNYSSTDLHYLKLDIDGKLIPYIYNFGRASWESGQPFMSNIFGSCLPMTCESHSVCAGSSQCSCIVQGQDGDQEQTCPSPSDIPLVCNHE
ncbi:hypothetical protein SELMODRAFT_448668, partial [Selaginella moellendorffii]